MGSADAGHDERPVHRVHVREFSIARFPVTQAEYGHFVRATGHPRPAVRDLPLIATVGHEDLFTERSAPYDWDSDQPPPGRGSHPVVLVTYDDAIAYCRWMSLALGRVVRLPTEAEWEKAARGGLTSTRYPWGNEIDASKANFLADGADRRARGTRPAGAYAPNAYGLYDMSGNVWEWVSDWYASDYYAVSEPQDPIGPPVGTLRVVRGGSWVTEDVAMLRCGFRHKVPPDTYSYSIGFRIVCETGES